MVPNGWTNQKLPEFAWFQEGPGLRKWQFTDSGCKVINITNIVNGYLDLTKTERHISQEELNEKYKHFLCDAGDIVIASSGNSYCKHGIVRKQDLPLVMNTSVIRFKPRENCDYEFLNQFLKSKYLKQQIDILITGGAQPNFGPAHLKQVELNLPPLPEQRKIAQILSTWDKAIATTEKLIDASKQQKKALVQQLLTGKKRLVDPETGKAFEGEWRKSKTPYESLPSDWSELALEKLSSFITKGATPTTYGFEWQEYGIPFLRSECVGKNGFKESGLNYICDDAHEAMARSKVYAGDILITITGNVGRVCRLPNKYPQANINQHIAKVTLKDENVCSDFIFHCLQDNKYQSNFERITTGQAYPQISLVQVRNTIVPLPPISEQQKIASVLTAADKEIELLEAKLAHLKQEKKALMQQLLTGKRRVKVAETEVA